MFDVVYAGPSTGNELASKPSEPSFSSYSSTDDSHSSSILSQDTVATTSKRHLLQHGSLTTFTLTHSKFFWRMHMICFAEHKLDHGDGEDPVLSEDDDEQDDIHQQLTSPAKSGSQISQTITIAPFPYTPKLCPQICDCFYRPPGGGWGWS